MDYACNLNCPTCGENRWPPPPDVETDKPVFSRCCNCGTEHNIDELAIQAWRKRVKAAQRKENPHLGSDFDEFMEEHT